jgi:hypothetical protein
MLKGETMKRDKAIDLIKKMINRTEENGATPAEAEAAAAEIQRLMIKFNLSLSEVERSDNNNSYEEQVVHDKNREYCVMFVVDLISEFYFVDFVFGRSDVIIFGEPHNVEIGKYLFHFLRRQFRECWERYRIEYAAQRSEMRPYFQGICYAIRQRLRAERRRYETHQQNALIVIEGALKKAFNERYGELPERGRSPVQNDPYAFEKGVRDGMNVSLHEAVADDRKRQTTLRIGS